MSDLIRLEQEGGIATVILDRPHKLNALTRPMWQQLGETVASLSQDDEIRCIVLRGAGEKSFSPGNDISEFETERANSEQAIAYGRIMHKTIAQLRACRHPMVAQIHGICVGGGLELAALCDIRICGSSSRFGAPIKNLGLVMAYAEMDALARLVGMPATLALLLEGRIIDAREALRLGMVNRVVADADVAEAARETAENIASGAPLVARWHKKFARRLAEGGPITESENLESFECFDTADFQEGRAAFLTRRTPQFTGR